MATPTRIRDCMRRNPLTISDTDNLVQAVETLVEYKLTGLTVTDEGGAVTIMNPAAPRTRAAVPRLDQT